MRDSTPTTPQGAQVEPESEPAVRDDATVDELLALPGAEDVAFCPPRAIGLSRPADLS